MGDTFTFYKSYQDAVKKAIFMEKEVLLFLICLKMFQRKLYGKGGDVTSMRKKDMGAAAELDKNIETKRACCSRS